MDQSARLAWNAARPGDPPFDTACVAPWVSIEFDPAGWVYACCTSHLYPIGRIGEQRLGDIWAGARAGVLGEALRRWDLSVACQPCRFHLEHRRMDPVAAVYDQYPLADDSPALPHMMLFALSNRCNLGCVMCTPELSSTLRAEVGLPPSVNPYDEQFFEDLDPFLHGLRVAKFLGGEPFLAPEHVRIWDRLEQLGVSPKLSITTNGTVFTSRVDRLFDRFEVDISVSVDAATPDTYAAIRRGGDLRQVHRNLDRFAARCREQGTNLHVSFCLMPQNAHELGDFLVWAEPYTFGAPVGINLVSDEGMALLDLPTDRLDEVRRRWEEQDGEISARLDRNLGVWRTQLDELDAVLAERRSGVDTAATRAHRMTELSPGDVPVGSRWSGSDRRRERRAVAAQGERLARWSGSDALAVLRCDPSGRVVAVDRPHGRLGISDALVGAQFGTLLEVMERADGRSAWVIDDDVVDDGELGVFQVRTVILAERSPVRGVPGAVVRIVSMPGPGRRTVLVAEDRFYDSGGVGNRTDVSTPVMLRSRRPTAPAVGSP